MVEQHIREVIGVLNEGAVYAVLRNFEGLPDHNSARDVDIIISRKEFGRVRPALLELFERTGWSVLTYLHSDRLITYVTAKQQGEELALMQWDFFFDTSVWGIQLMSAEEFLRHRQWNGFLYYVPVGPQFLDKYLYDRAVGAKYPEKYRSTLEAARDLPEVREKLRETFGCASVEECDRTPGRKLILRALWANLKRRPAGCIAEMGRFVWTFVGNYLRSSTGFSIGFTGPDGAGKTTVIDGMIEQWGDVFRTAHVYYHFRPALFGNLGDVAHSAGLKRDVDRNYSDPHRGGRTGWLSSLARLCYYSVDYIVGYWLKVKTKTRITRTVVFDRYYTDIICDSRRSRIYLPMKLLYWWGRLLIPQLDYNILLTADTDVILGRKDELEREGIEEINSRIDYLASKKGYYKVLNNASPAAAIAQIQGIILKNQDARNRKRNGKK